MKGHVYQKNLDIYNYYTLDGYPLEQCIKHWKSTKEWITDKEFSKNKWQLNNYKKKWVARFKDYYNMY